MNAFLGNTGWDGERPIKNAALARPRLQLLHIIILYQVEIGNYDMFFEIIFPMDA
jgi:hypothetical protein